MLESGVIHQYYKNGPKDSGSKNLTISAYLGLVREGSHIYSSGPTETPSEVRG